MTAPRHTDTARDSAPGAGLPALAHDGPVVGLDEVIAHYRAADGAVMKLALRAGAVIERRLDGLPAEARGALEAALQAALRRAWAVCGATDRGRARGWLSGPSGHRGLAVASGAVGGFFGPAGLAELPVAVTVMLRAIRQVARGYGYDPDDPEIARECLAVFASGGPLPEDDGVDTAFLTARLAIRGAQIERLVPQIALRMAGMLGQRIGASAVPILGALGGATVNYAFLRFYTEMAHVHFGLRRLSEGQDRETVFAAFRHAVAAS